MHASLAGSLPRVRRPVYGAATAINRLLRKVLAAILVYLLALSWRQPGVILAS